jgi:hypothetical protein
MDSADYRFVAFSTINGLPQAHAGTAAAALRLAAIGLPDAGFLEVLDCGDNGGKVWTGGVTPTRPVALHKARELHRTAFRGAGYASSHNPLPAVPLPEPDLAA